MNWRKIKKNYLKAYNSFKSSQPEHLILDNDGMNWHCTDGVHIIVQKHPYNLRDLYDFFDEQQIKISITCTHGFDAYICKGCECYPYVKENRELTMQARDKYDGKRGIFFDTRQEAETAAFEKAFKILEEKLK